MKNSLILLLPAYLLMLPIALAQSKLSAGIRMGMQSPSFRYNTPVQASDYLKITPYYFRWRTIQGLGLHYQFRDRWSLAADCLYSLQGGGYEERKTNLNYLQVPVLIGYNAASRHSLQFNIQTGASLSYLLSAKMIYSDGERVDIASYVNRISCGVPFAVGLRIRVAKNTFLNNQLYAYTDFKTLSKTNSAFKVNNYILPGIKLSIDRSIR